MDRRRAAGALLALAACLATSHAAPTATSNQTALDLYDEVTVGCYYNFQHYGEGDRIMTNEPCLNCTCHNRMLMCYLRVCPFTKAIGQDCTVEKRADQCCPIVTCPDVPVDLLTSTSTSSPAEYGGTGVGKVDKYGCSINGKYFPEGAKVPPTPNKPCEHCYCIRNMTTCVMQECTLHVDGCTPIYHKDVCCPVRYFCDHPEDEMPLLDDMTTTVRPTPGFLLTTIAPTEATYEPETVTLPARRDCFENDQLYPDGALIKTDKPCQHCYCMKGDIVCVVQECGTPMENEGKNCTSLPPREGQCCPDTYICEGDELSSEPTTALPFDEISTTTFVPPRRVSVEGSGYRNEDEIPYTEAPTFATDLEGSGEEDLTEKPVIDTTEGELLDKFGSTDESEFVPESTISSLTEVSEKATTEPDRGLNTVPSEEEITKPAIQEQSTPRSEINITEPSRRTEYQTESPMITEKVSELESSQPSLPEVTATPEYEVKKTEPSIIDELATSTISSVEQTPELAVMETTPQEEQKSTESSITGAESQKPEGLPVTEPSILETPAPTETSQTSEHPDIFTEKERVTTESLVTETYSGQELETEKITQETSSTQIPVSEYTTTAQDIEDQKTGSTLSELTTELSKVDVTEGTVSEQNTVPVNADEEQSSKPSAVEITTAKIEIESTKLPDLVDQQTEQPQEESSETYLENTTLGIKGETTQGPILQEEAIITSEPAIKEAEISTKVPGAVITETPYEQTEGSSVTDSDEHRVTTALPSREPEMERTTAEPIMELSTFAHITEKEPVASTIPEIETTSAATEKIDLPETTTANEADNEIRPPGRIPGEGDCLLEGVTYKNDSVVPSTNKCHTGCKCVSSIIKCDPIICSSPPEDMDNCQPRYDTPDSCCPTYICDHGMETIPPQPQSHITGTESPTLFPAVECSGDQCPVSEDKQEPALPSVTNECEGDSCQIPARVPTEECTANECELPKPSPETEFQQPPIDVSQEIPVHVPQAGCSNPEDCKETFPASCEGTSCPSGAPHDLCDPEKGCPVEPEIPPAKIIPELCGSSGECKPVSIPESGVPICEGKSCSIDENICNNGDCAPVSSSPQPSQAHEKPQVPSECEEGNCVDENLTNKFECTGDGCLQQEPVLPTQETPFTGLIDIASTSQSEPAKEAETTPHKETYDELTEKVQLPSEASISDTSEERTTVPYSKTETESPVGASTETPAISATETHTDRPDVSKESKPSDEEQQASTELPSLDSETPVYPKLPEIVDMNEITQAPEKIEPEEKISTTLPEEESRQPESPATTSQGSTPKSVGEKDITETSIIPVTESQGQFTVPEAVSPESSTDSQTKSPQETTSGDYKPDISTEHGAMQTVQTAPSEIATETPEDFKGSEIKPTDLIHAEVTKGSEETTPTSLPELDETRTALPDTYVSKPESTLPEEKLKPDLLEPYQPAQVSEPTVTMSPQTETSWPEIEKESEMNLEKATTTEKQDVKTEYPVSTVTEAFVKHQESSQTTYTPYVPETEFEKTTVSVVEEEEREKTTTEPEKGTDESEISSGKPDLLSEVSPTEQIDLETKEPEKTSTAKPEEPQQQSTKGPFYEEIVTDYPENILTTQEPEYGSTEATIIPVTPKDISKTPLHQPEGYTTEGEFSTPQKLSTESSITETDTKTPEIAPVEGETPSTTSDKTGEYEQTERPLLRETNITEKPEVSTEISQKETSPDQETEMEQSDIKKPSTPATSQEIATAALYPSTESIPTETKSTSSVTEEEKPTEAALPTVLPETTTTASEKISAEKPAVEFEQKSTEQPAESATPEVEVGTEQKEPEKEEPTPTLRPETENEIPALITTAEGELQEPSQTSRPASEQQEPLQTSRPEVEQEEPIQTSKPSDEQEESAITSKPEDGQEEATQTTRPESEQKEEAQTEPKKPEEPTLPSRPEIENEIPVQKEPSQTTKPASEEQEPSQTSLPEGELEEPMQTSTPAGEQQEPSQTSRPEGEQEEPMQTSTPAGEQQEPSQTVQPAAGQEEPSQTFIPEDEQKEPAPTSKPEDQQKEAPQTSTPAEQPTQTMRPEDEQEETTQTTRPAGEQTEPTQTSKPQGEQEDPTQTSRPAVDQEESAQTTKPEGEKEKTSQPEEFAQTSRPVGEEEPQRTSTPEGEREESAQTSKPESELEEPTHILRPEEEQKESAQTPSTTVQHEEPAYTSRPEGEQEEPIQTTKPADQQEEAATTSKPERDEGEPAQTTRPEEQTSRPAVEQEEPVKTTAPQGEQEEQAQTTTRPTVEQEQPTQTSRPVGEQEEFAQTSRPEGEQQEPAQTSRPAVEQEEHLQTTLPELQTASPETGKPELSTDVSTQTPTETEQSETTPYLVELELHTHKMDEESTSQPSQEPTTSRIETPVSEQEPTERLPSQEFEPDISEKETERPIDQKEEIPVPTEEPQITTIAQEEPEKSSEPSLIDKYGTDKPEGTTIGPSTGEEELPSIPSSPETEIIKTEKPVSADEIPTQSVHEPTIKPIYVPIETTAPEEEFIPVTAKVTTVKAEEEISTQPPAKPEKPSDTRPSTQATETPKPDELPPVDEEFPPSGGYNQEPEPDYADEDQAFGPGTCRYGGKVYVSAQQIPRDDPCDFCFCFRSDIICLQQSCPPPIHGCHEEPIQGFCCPRYECPVSMATTLNVTTTTTTTTTTLPPHFLPHAYKGAAQRRGCQIKGHTYQVGEVVRASSGPCLHCTCGGDGQMKCDPKACTPEPMLRQMIAAAVSAKRRR